MESPQSGLRAQIENEIQQYLTGVVQVSEDNNYSQAKLVRRISLFENHIYPTGKFDSQGNYKFWFDIIPLRIDSEVKNVDFDTKNITAYSDRKIDELPNIIVNLKIKEYLRENGQAEELNSAIEEGSGWGNVVWKKVKKGYERVDLKNFYVINQTAKCLDESPCIERHELSQSDLRAKSGAWEYVEEVIKECKLNSYQETAETRGMDTTVPYYLIYERNGEVSVKDLKEAKGKTVREGDENKYVLAKVIVAASKGTGPTGGTVNVKYVLFADEISKMPYKEYHRSRYKGRWFREGLTELLFDLQVRANQIGNQLAQGLEWASKTIFTSNSKLIIQNVLTDLKNGDIIRAENLQHLQVRMEGLDQLANDWNRVIQMANDIANSREIVQGEALPSGTPFRLGALYNQNANKLFDFIREKLAIPLSEIFEEWIIPQLVKELKVKEVMRLVGDSDLMERLRRLVVDSWYLENLLAIGPHDAMTADMLKTAKLEELKQRPQLLMKGLAGVFEGYKPNVSIVITGENSTMNEDLQTLSSFAQLEADPIRRSAIVELMARKKGLDFGALPKSQPVQQPQPVSPITPLAGVPVGAKVA